MELELDVDNVIDDAAKLDDSEVSYLMSYLLALCVSMST